MINHSSLSKLLLTALLISIAGVSCTPTIYRGTTTSTRGRVEGGATHSPTQAPSQTPAPPASETPLPTVTITPTPVPQWTPLPTLLDTQAEQTLVGWLGGTPDCLFPCWGGITPGVTTWQEAKQILGAVVNVQEINENSTCIFGSCKDIDWQNRTNHDLNGYIVSRSNNIIYGIFLEGYHPTPTMRLDRILTLYGKPDKVFVEAYNYINPDIAFYLTLSYPNHQFIIHFVWSAYYSNNKYTACIQNESINVFVMPVEEPWTGDYIYKLVNPGGQNPQLFRPIEDATTDMTIDQFYNKFKTFDSSDCISTPANEWP
jgi:hypothetical protein